MVEILAVVAVLLGTACSVSSSGGGERANERQADGGGRDASTSTTLDPRAPAVVEGYKAYWIAFLASADPPNPESPELAEHATDEELERARSALSGLARAGDVLRGSYAHSASISSIGDAEAVVADCLAPRISVHDAATGDVTVEETPAASLVTAEMVLDGDTWKVALIDADDASCPPGGVGGPPSEAAENPDAGESGEG